MFSLIINAGYEGTCSEQKILRWKVKYFFLPCRYLHILHESKKKSFDCLNNSNLNEQKNLIFNYNSVFFSVFVIKGNNHDDNHNYI